MSIKQVIAVRRDLNMRKGKFAAQVAHASGAFLEKIIWNQRKASNVEREWHSVGKTKIVVQVENEAELFEVFHKAKNLGIEANLIQDSGRTEFQGVPTYTCVAIGPDVAEKVDSVTGHLKLF